MKDFLGQDLVVVGGFIVYPGAGNTAAEYGLILHKIIDIDPEKKSIRTERLDVRYKEGGGKDEIRRVKTTIKALTKVVMVNPPEQMIKVFESGDMKYFDLIGKWLHGRTEINWDTLKVGQIGD